MSSAATPPVERPIRNIGNDPSMVRGVPIHESGDPLVEVRQEEGIFVAPAYYEHGIHSAPNRVIVREEVLSGLRRAAAVLPEGTALLLWDGLRSLETQAEIVEAFQKLQREKGVNEPLETYLAPPPPSEEAFLAEPPPHATGGAVDLSLCDDVGRPLNMGAEFDEFNETAWLAHFENPADPPTSADVTYRNRRRVLYWAMMDAGFAPYPWEYWHYEFKTTVYANFYNLPPARYGAAVPWTSQS